MRQENHNTSETANNDITLPSCLADYHPELHVYAHGDAMADVGVDDGDLLRVRLTQSARDGDIVVAMLGNSILLRALFTDEQGRRWLVSRNDGHDAIPLTAESGMQLLGTVVGIKKVVVRASAAECQRSIRRTQARQQAPQPPTDEEVDDVLRTVAPEVQNGRQWYAVYRALADFQVQAEQHYVTFCQRVRRAVPAHRYLPVPKEIGRMAAQSVRKRVALWRADDAPVGERCFAQYQRIALLTTEELKARSHR
jgi:hypothetical protein